MADELTKNFGVDVQLVEGRNGIFDVIVDGTRVYSKAKTGRFPDPGEVSKLLGHQ